MSDGKDPAVLFYTSDFLTGTMVMTDEQVGKYIRLLCLQHQRGRLSEKHMLSICKTYDEDVFSKFIKDEEGMYYNRRMELEAIKRKSFTESRRNNAKGGKNKDKKPKSTRKAYAKHMENENENVNVNKDKDVVEEKAEIVFPFDSENFRAQWNIWKDYKQKEFDFKFKSLGSEQANLTQLSNLAENETEAIAIIHQSMANGWKGFFKIKNETNGVTKKHNFVFTADDFKR
jgi:uncharacterized protein YdaU (DUF1376 family)